MKKIIGLDDDEMDTIYIPCRDKCGIMEIERFGDSISMAYYEQKKISKKCVFEVMVNDENIDEIIESLLKMKSNKKK